MTPEQKIESLTKEIEAWKAQIALAESFIEGIRFTLESSARIATYVPGHGGPRSPLMLELGDFMEYRNAEGYVDPVELSKSSSKAPKLAEQAAMLAFKEGRPLRIEEIMVRFGYDPKDKIREASILGSLNQAHTSGRYLVRTAPSTYDRHPSYIPGYEQATDGAHGQPTLD